MMRIDRDTFEVVGASSGRRYLIVRCNRARYRGMWDVCNPAGGRYGTFANLPGARNWTRVH